MILHAALDESLFSTIIDSARPFGLFDVRYLSKIYAPLGELPTERLYVLSNTEVQRRELLPKGKPTRRTGTFETEAEAQDFAQAKVSEGLVVFAGTLQLTCREELSHHIAYRFGSQRFRERSDRATAIRNRSRVARDEGASQSGAECVDTSLRRHPYESRQGGLVRGGVGILGRVRRTCL